MIPKTSHTLSTNDALFSRQNETLENAKCTITETTLYITMDLGKQTEEIERS